MAELQTFVVEKEFQLESGAKLDELTIAYHTYGTLNKDKSNVIWVFHALTGNSDVLDWWSGLFGDKNLFDPAEYFIICANAIGSPYGSTKPTDLAFPHFSVRDIVNAHFLLADHLDINLIHIAIGGSFGGNQALEFAYNYTGKIDNLIVIASCAKESAWSIAVHETQRMAMKSDSSFGEKDGGTEGMAAARAIGMLTYRTSDSFIETQTDSDDKVDNFKASAYIQYQGEKFIKRFDPLSYYYLTKCLDTHNIGRDRGNIAKALKKINIPTLVIGIESDILIPITLQKEMANALPQSKYAEIKSEYGHDGFLVETEKISVLITDYLAEKKPQRAVLKFGGSSLKNGTALEDSISIITKEASKQSIAVIVSARGGTTDQLLAIYKKATEGKNTKNDIDQLMRYQLDISEPIDLRTHKQELSKLTEALQTLEVSITEIENRILAFGELMSARVVTTLLQKRGLKAVFVDAREIIVTYKKKGELEIDHAKSREKATLLFSKLDPHVVPIITGFIAIDEKGLTTTLGRNGSNYSATLIANYIGASEIQNWTDVNGVYSAHPKHVKKAVRIPHLSYKEANELANFGASVLHSKTIIPLIDSNIPIRILNSYAPNSKGTLIDKTGSGKGIKAISLIENVSLVSIEGLGLSGKVGIDSRIFTALSNKNISVRLISQASSERGIGFIIDDAAVEEANVVLREEFHEELANEDISDIVINESVAILAITGRHNYALEKAVAGLRKHKIWIHVFSNSITGENISLVIDSAHAYTALNVVHKYVIEES